MNRRRFLAIAFSAGVCGAAGCTSLEDDLPNATEEDTYDLAVTHDFENWSEYDPDWTHPTEPPDLDVTVETVIEDLEVPWDLAFAPDGDLFISERPGSIAAYDSTDLETVAAPNVLDRADAIDVDDEGGWWDGGSEGGLMGLAVHPNYPDTPLVYAVYTAETNGGYENRVVYYDVSAENPTETETLVVGGIDGNEIIHNGSRIAFGPANYLWVTTGDADDREAARDPGTLAGSVLRLEPDGSAPDTNPDIDGGDDRVYSYGHRNPQGISFLPDGTPVVTEHGPDARDEVHVLDPGDNHGWGPEGETGRDGETYPGTDYDRPLVNTGPDETWAPSGCVFYTGDAVPSWQNRLLVGGLISQRLQIVTIYPTDGTAPSAERGTTFDADWMNEEYDAVAHTVLEDELGRIRHVEQGPDGTVYAVTSNRDGRAHSGFPIGGDDRLVRIELA